MTPSNKTGRILAIDYGQRRVGLAISDQLRILAQPLPTIKVTSLNQLLDKIGKIIIEKDVVEIVIGMPYHMKGTPGKTAQQVTQFIQKLNKRFNIPVHQWDERLTSVAAQRTIREMGKSPSRHKEKIDQISAQLLLQSYLDYIKRRKTDQWQ